MRELDEELQRLLAERLGGRVVLLVQERQRRARQKGLDERRAGARMEPDAEESPKAPDSPATNGNDAARPAGIVKRGKAKQSTDVRPRAREGAWRDVKKAS